MATLQKENTTLTVRELKLLFYSELSLDELNQVENMQPLTDLLVASIDSTLRDREFGLPLPKPSINQLSTTELFVYDNFLLVQSK